jgi:hypothetical protein
MPCSTYVPDGFQFKTLGGSTFQSGFTLKVDCAHVSDVCDSSG